MTELVGEAVALLERAAAARPDDVVIRHKLTHALAKAGRFGDTVTSVLRAVAAHPEWTQAHYELLETLTNAGYGEGVNRAVHERAAQEAGNAVVWYVLGMSYQTLGRHDEAVAAYRKGLERDPTSAVLLNNLGSALKITSGDAACIHHQQQAIAHSTTLAEPHYVLGVLFMKTGRHEEATKHFETFLELGQPYLKEYLNDARFSLSLMAGRFQRR